MGEFMQGMQGEADRREALSRAFSGSAAAGSAEDMIRANEAAQALEVETLKETVSAYQLQIEELRRQAVRNAELAEEMRRLNEDTVRALQEVVNSYVETLTECAGALRGVDFAGMQSGIQTTMETTGTGIQESLQQMQKRLEELLEQKASAEALQQMQQSLEESQKRGEESRQQSDDFAHKENVRVYRNVQAATEQLLTRQTGELNAQFDELKKPRKPKISWIQIVTLILAGACVVLEVLNILGIFG